MKKIQILLDSFLSAPRSSKRLLSLFYDLLAIPSALIISLSLRTGDLPHDLNFDNTFVYSLIITTLISITAFIKFGLYRAVVRFMTQEAYTRIVIAVAISSLTLSTSTFLLQANLPRSVPIIYFFIACALVGFPRIFIRGLISQIELTSRTPVAIYGAGIQGIQLATSLAKSDKFKAVIFIDDNKRKVGTNIQGLNVISSEALVSKPDKFDVKKILLALGNSPRSIRKNIISRLSSLQHIEVLTTPSMQDIVSGKAKIEEVHHVEVEDLLGRDPVKPDEELLSKCIENKVVLVTGAGGSIGSEICRQVIRLKPCKLILFELNEYSLYKIEQELNLLKDQLHPKVGVISLLGSVQNQNRLETIFKAFRVDTIYHAAAYKHVPMVEHNVVEGVRNNIFGTWYCAEAAISANVKNFVLISTDKAVRPTNVMGTSKRVAELVLQALSRRQSETRFCMVRFGNVLGSSGSVVPLFRKQIAQGGPITVTHPDITRYFMTIPEASQLVIQAGSIGKGGDVFVLDMGEAVKIYELAQKMIKLSGLTVRSKDAPNGDIEIEFSGLRPGEKLFEELLIGDNVAGTCHPRIMTANEIYMDWPETHNLLHKLDRACHESKVQDVIDLLIKAPTLFNKQNASTPDWVFNQRI